MIGRGDGGGTGVKCLKLSISAVTSQWNLDFKMVSNYIVLPKLILG